MPEEEEEVKEEEEAEEEEEEEEKKKQKKKKQRRRRRRKKNNKKKNNKNNNKHHLCLTATLNFGLLFHTKLRTWPFGAQWVKPFSQRVLRSFERRCSAVLAFPHSLSSLRQ
jgi:signal recognition particle GTPase